MVNNTALPEELQEKLAELGKLLQSNSIVKEFHTAQAEIEKDSLLKEKEEAMKQEQKEAVQAKYYEKNNALQAAEITSDSLKEELETDIKVIHYREALMEANDLLQYMTDYIQITLERKMNERYQDEES